MTVGASRMRVMLDAEQGRIAPGATASAAATAPVGGAGAAEAVAHTPHEPHLRAAEDAASAVPDAAAPTFVAAAVVEQASSG